MVLSIGLLSTLSSKARAKRVYVHSKVCVIVTGEFQNVREGVAGASVTRRCGLVDTQRGTGG